MNVTCDINIYWRKTELKGKGFSAAPPIHRPKWNIFCPLFAGYPPVFPWVPVWRPWPNGPLQQKRFILFRLQQTPIFRLTVLTLLFAASYAPAQTTFTEQAASKGLNLDGRKDGGFTFADFNNDGYLDLMLNTLANDTLHRSRLYFSSGPPNYTFTDVTNTHALGLVAAGLEGGSTVERCGVAGDLNHDGYLDFIRNSANRFELYLNNGPSSGYTFGQGANQDPNFQLSTAGTGNNSPPNGIPNGMNTEGIGFFDYDNDGDLDIMIENHNWGIDIYRNEIIPSGTFSLTHVTTGTGFPLGLDQTAVDGDYASVTDFDDDGYIDIVARKRDMEDFWRNNGNGTFSPVNWVDQQADNGDKGAVALYDYDNDGDYDLLWTNNDVNQIWQQTGVGSGTFVGTNEPENSSGITLPLAGVDGAASGDIDNDGDIDLFLANDSGASFLFINTTPPGSTTLQFQLDNGGIDINGDAEGATFVDFDRDGDLDLYVNVNNRENQLWINNLNSTQRDQHLVVKVYENVNNSIPNRDAIGANIVLLDCSGNVISGVREVNGGNGHGTQDPSFVHFGLPLGANQEYIVEAHYPYLNGSRRISQFKVTPADLGTYHLLEITPQSVVDAPTAVDDNGGNLYLGQTADYAVLSNDFDTGGDAFSITAITAGPANGSASSINSNTEIRYVADNTVGPVTITYRICETDCAVLCDEATLTINLLAETDYGDAPASYGDICYTINPGGSSGNPAGIPFGPTRLGSLIDGDSGSTYSSDADGDDGDGTDDEDGVTFVGGNTLQSGTTEQVTLSWSTNDYDGYIYGWIDFNADGDFDDPSERIVNGFGVGNGTANGSAGTHTFSYSVPNSAVCAQSYARFTIQSDPTEYGPTGTYCSTGSVQQDGEVEDYQVNIVGCTEDCTNNYDDDGDGLVDCDDPDCSLGLSLNLGLDVEICTGSGTTLSAAVSGGTSPYSYAWDNGLGNSASHSVSPSSTTTYSLTITDGNGCTRDDQITVTVVTSITGAGVIGSDEERCNAYDPATISEVTPPPGGSGGSLEYRWRKRESDHCQANWGAWEFIAGANAATYDPPTISRSTQFQRQARNLPCSSWFSTNIVTKVVDTTAPTLSCDPDDLTYECDGSNIETLANNWNSSNLSKLNGCVTDACGSTSVSSDYDFSLYNVDCGSTGELTVTYTIADDCDNRLTRQATFRLRDTAPPSIVNVPDQQVECTSIPTPGSPSVSDQCDPSVAVDFEEVTIYHPNANWKSSGACSLLYAISSAQLLDQGNANPADDQMRFRLTVIGQNTGANWQSTIGGTLYSGTYNEPLDIGPFTSGGSTYSFVLEDGTSSSCQLNIVVDASSF